MCVRCAQQNLECPLGSVKLPFLIPFDVSRKLSLLAMPGKTWKNILGRGGGIVEAK